MVSGVVLLREAIDTLLGEDPDRLSCDELAGELRAVRAQQRRLDAVVAGRLGVFARRGGPTVVSGLRSTASWVRVELGDRPAAAAHLGLVAETLAAMPATRAAWETGEIGLEHAFWLARAQRTAPDAFVCDEADPLVGFAQSLRPDVFAQVIRRWLAIVAPGDGTDPYENRRLHRRLVGDQGIVEMIGDLESHATVAAAIAAWAARLARGDDHGPQELRRTPTQLEHDALVDLCEHALGWLAAAAPARVPAHITAMVTLDQLVGAADPDVAADLAAGIDRIGYRFDHTTLQQLCCDAEVAINIVDGDRVPLNLGRGERYASRAQRRALAYRDRGCAFPGCPHTPERCLISPPLRSGSLGTPSIVHHIDPWDHGGPTDIANLCLLCRYHHRLIHNRNSGWTVETGHNGHPTFRRPDHTILPHAPPMAA